MAVAWTEKDFNNLENNFKKLGEDLYDKEKDGIKNYTNQKFKVGGYAFIFNTQLALCQHGLDSFFDQFNENKDKFTKSSVFELTVKWLAGIPGLNLDAWNAARKSCYELTFTGVGKEKLQPAKKSSIQGAINDCVKRVAKLPILFVINPVELARLPGLSLEALELTSFQLGAKLAKENLEQKKVVAPIEVTTSSKKNAKETNATKKKETFTEVLKKNKKKKFEVVGTSNRSIGVKPRTVSLYLRIKSGGKIGQIQQLLESKPLRAKNVKCLKLSENDVFSTYQVQADVEESKGDFWKFGNFWPKGTFARRWSGNVERRNLDDFRQIVQISGIKTDDQVGKVTLARIEDHLRSTVYKNVKFNSIEFGEFVNGSVKVLFKVSFGDEGRDALLKTGLNPKAYPAGVKVRHCALSAGIGMISPRTTTWANPS